MISNEIRSDLKRIYTAFAKYNVDCLLIGGSAVAFYGYQRISGFSMFNPEAKTDLEYLNKIQKEK